MKTAEEKLEAIRKLISAIGGTPEQRRFQYVATIDQIVEILDDK